MTNIFRAALLALSIGGIGTAYAGDGEGPIANTQFTLIAQASGQKGSVVTAMTNGTAVCMSGQPAVSATRWGVEKRLGC